MSFYLFAGDWLLLLRIKLYYFFFLSRLWDDLLLMYFNRCFDLVVLLLDNLFLLNLNVCFDLFLVMSLHIYLFMLHFNGCRNDFYLSWTLFQLFLPCFNSRLLYFLFFDLSVGDLSSVFIFLAILFSLSNDWCLNILISRRTSLNFYGLLSCHCRFHGHSRIRDGHIS